MIAPSLMRMRSLLLAPCAVAALFAAEQVTTPISNDDVRVLSVLQQPHEPTKMHQHAFNRVMIYRQAGTQDFKFQDGRSSTLKWRAGEVKWSPAGGMHIAELTSAEPVNIIEIELKKKGAGRTADSPLDPLKIDPKHYKLEFENDQVRVFRVIVGPHAASPMHEHTLKRVVTYLTDANVRVTGADGKVETQHHEVGDVVWGEHAKHSEQNLGDKPFEVVVTELKY
jgi:uncharacterized RmlC-like cupin family protein